MYVVDTLAIVYFYLVYFTSPYFYISLACNFSLVVANFSLVVANFSLVVAIVVA